MTRALATIRRIAAIRDIPGADAIAAAQVEGWTVVVKKGEFAPGDLCVYFEIDSFLPTDDIAFAFLDKHAIQWRGRRGAVLRTMTMRGQLSQGLALPLDVFPRLSAALRLGLSTGQMNDETLRRLDLGAELGVVKFEHEIPDAMKASAIGATPSILNSPSLERVQNIPEAFEQRRGEIFDLTVKIDGMTAHVFQLDGRLRAAQQNWEMREDGDNPLWQAIHRQKLDRVLNDPAYDGMQFQGELHGKGVEGVKDKRAERPTFTLFHGYDTKSGRHIGVDGLQDLVSIWRRQGVEIDVVTHVGRAVMGEGDLASVEAILARADAATQTIPDAKGLVLKTRDGAFAFKAISNRYLRKNG